MELKPGEIFSVKGSAIKYLYIGYNKGIHLAYSKLYKTICSFTETDNLVVHNEEQNTLYKLKRNTKNHTTDEVFLHQHFTDSGKICVKKFSPMSGRLYSIESYYFSKSSLVPLSGEEIYNTITWPKYNIGDYVYIINRGNVISGKIKDITLSLGNWYYSIDNYFVKCPEEEIIYTTKDINILAFKTYTKISQNFKDKLSDILPKSIFLEELLEAKSIVEGGLLNAK